MMTRTSHRAVIFCGAAAASIFLASCGAPRSTAKCQGDDCWDSDPTPLGFCVRDEDCPGDQVCNGGQCEPPGDPVETCDENRDCDFGLLCDTDIHRCVECLDDYHCFEGEVCHANGVCGPGCTDNSDCGGGLVCNDQTGRCVECVTSGDCPNGQTCSEEICVETAECQTDAECNGKLCDPISQTCVPCANDIECGALKICEPNSGVCVDPECTNASQCPAGNGCHGGRCGPCYDTNECRTGETCNTATGVCEGPECTTAAQCDPGEGCHNQTCGPCHATNECRADEICNTSNHTCEPPPPECTGNGDCLDGRVCIGEECVDCTNPSQCDAGLDCQNGRCVNPGTAGLGDPCTDAAECAPGHVCLYAGTADGFCSRVCIASGKGPDVDCPLGYGCINYESGALDGVMLCDSAQTVAASYPGQPFDMAPGDDCSNRNGCQTSYCISDTQVCARGCAANRDCAADEVCYAVIKTSGAHTGEHFCVRSDLQEYRPAGDPCHDGWQCDSGICEGTCSGSVCNSSGDCGLFGTCNGTCRDHCRSNADCGVGESCNPWPMQIGWDLSGWVNICNKKYFNGTRADGQACTDHDQCASDWCVGDICTTPCAATADCTGNLSGRACTPITFVDNQGNPDSSMAFCL